MNVFYSGVQWISAYFENCHKIHQKSVERAAKVRQEGNKCFQRKQYVEAASKYTEAILNAPCHTEDLSLAYGNRSAVLFHLGLFKECLVDIHEAIEQGFPESMTYKLHVRKLHCLRNLGHTEKFQKSIAEAKEAIRKGECDLKKKEQLVKEIQDMEAKSTTREVREEAKLLPTVSHGNNQVLVQASAAVSLQCNDKQGRFLTASQDIKAGDTLIVERPFAAVLLPDHYRTHCHHCYVKLNYSFPCRQCSQVRYCSSACAEKSWQLYHSTECTYLQLLHSVGIAHLSLRVVLVAGLDFLKDFRQWQAFLASTQPVPGLDDHGQYCRSYLTVYDLMTHADHMETDDLLQYTMTACLLLRILQHSGWFTRSLQESDNNWIRHTEENTLDRYSSNDHELPGKHLQERESCRLNSLHGNDRDICRYINEITLEMKNSSVKESCLELEKQTVKMGNDEEKTNSDVRKRLGGMNDMELYIGGLLLRHIQQLVCNAHAITELQCSQAGVGSVVEDLSQVRIATAIYPTASLMNHSCDPSIISSFHKDTLVVRAVKAIPKGGEIFNCYGPHHKRMSFTERQRVLREQYFFTCQCPPCVEGEKVEGILYSFKCPACTGPLVLTASGEYVCQNCSHKSVTVDIQKAETAKDIFHRAVILLQENKVQDALQLIKKCCKIRTELLYRHNKDLSEAQDCLARCYAMLGYYREAADQLKKSLETVKVIYGEASIESASEMQKLSELLISAQSWREALSVTEEAINVFTLHYGKTHEVVRELMAAREQLIEVTRQ